MLKERLRGFLIVGSLLGIGGFVMIVASVNLGTSRAESWLVNRGGADTGYYHIIVNSYINTFLVAGGILFGVGLLIVTFTFYKLQLKGLHK